MSGQESKKKKRPRDLNLLARSIVEDAVQQKFSEEEDVAQDSPSKNPHAVALGRLGGLRGGKIRAEKLSPEKRSEIARKAANSRWAKKNK